MTTPISPITNRNNTVLAGSIPVADIISLYQAQLDMDVSRFFGKNKKIDLYKCRETGYKFYFPTGLEGDSSFYEMLQTKLNGGYYHSWKFENQFALDILEKGDKVLDIGCGVGNFLLRAREKTTELFGLELNVKAAEHCMSEGLKVYNESISEHAVKHPNFYDVIVLFQVLEHLYDVHDFINSCLSVLKPGGKLVIGVPNNEPFFYGYDKYCTLNLPPHHMGLWNRKVFIKFAELFNLSTIKVLYDIKGRISVHAYHRAKYLARVKSLPGQHSPWDKLKISLAAFIAVPETILKNIMYGLNGSHIAILFQKK